MLTAYIGMGSNLPSAAGPPAATLASAIERLGSLGHVLSRSSLYSTAPVGIADQPRFVNAVVALRTGLAPRTLLTRLLAIERDYGRDRSTGITNGPRTLDLDILMMGDLCLSESELELPHPRLAERAFVLIPLHEIAPEVIEPRHHVSIAELLARLRAGNQSQADSVLPIHDPLWDGGAGLGASAGRRAQADAGQPDRDG
jgi:2-amino-4-hydroxy-6-hydroxymethyldihydropteridine diphosphokinase